jgi:hypothetical protein
MLAPIADKMDVHRSRRARKRGGDNNMQKDVKHESPMLYMKQYMKWGVAGCLLLGLLVIFVHTMTDATPTGVTAAIRTRTHDEPAKGPVLNVTMVWAATGLVLMLGLGQAIYGTFTAEVDDADDADPPHDDPPHDVVVDYAGDGDDPPHDVVVHAAP